MDKPNRLRLTLGSMIVLVALAAVVINAYRPAHTKIVDVKVGSGPAAQAGDTVSVHYVGKLRDGTVFDESKPRGAPLDFVVDGGMVIKGWDVGVAGMQVGGVRTLIIPPDEGYGAKGVGPIPPNSTLYFEVELLGIK